MQISSICPPPRQCFGHWAVAAMSLCACFVPETIPPRLAVQAPSGKKTAVLAALGTVACEERDNVESD